MIHCTVTKSSSHLVLNDSLHCVWEWFTESCLGMIHWVVFVNDSLHCVWEWFTEPCLVIICWTTLVNDSLWLAQTCRVPLWWTRMAWPSLDMGGTLGQWSTPRRRSSQWEGSPSWVWIGHEPEPPQPQPPPPLPPLKPPPPHRNQPQSPRQQKWQQRSPWRQRSTLPVLPELSLPWMTTGSPCLMITECWTATLKVSSDDIHT